MSKTSISNRTRLFEISAVVFTVACKFLFMDFLNLKLPFIASAIILWSCYVIYQSTKNPGIGNYWGFRMDNFKTVVQIILPFGIISLIVCTCIGIYQQSINISWHIIPILILYPVWGIIQQFLLIALTVGNLQDINNSGLPRLAIIVSCAVLFALVHYPYVWLAIATFVLAVFYGLIYIKQRNLYALGIFHGWLGAIYFYTVVNRDPYLETFGRLFHSNR